MGPCALGPGCCGAASRDGGRAGAPHRGRPQGELDLLLWPCIAKTHINKRHINKPTTKVTKSQQRDYVGLAAMVQPHKMEVVQGRLVVADPEAPIQPAS